MALMDSTIRMSYKIRPKSNKYSNFIGYIFRESGKLSTFYFYSKNGFLYIHGSDVGKDSSGVSNKLSECGDVELLYDEISKTITIKLASRNGKYNFETAIYVGDKLWKKPL